MVIIGYPLLVLIQQIYLFVNFFSKPKLLNIPIFILSIYCLQGLMGLSRYITLSIFYLVNIFRFVEKK
jgi:uncharacterized membrane-anchored protein YitT (DUF2179 family)